MISNSTSLIQYLVASKFGGVEHPIYIKKDIELIEKTFNNPKWYIDLRIDYPLLLYAIERLDSGEFDRVYNEGNDLYAKIQGNSSRIWCPVYLFIKIHTLILELAINLDDNDYYVSDLFDVLQCILRHVERNDLAWHDMDINSEYPTPFVFLIKEIFSDFKWLCEQRIDRGANPPGRIGHDFVRIWMISTVLVLRSEEKLPLDFRLNHAAYLCDFMLQIHEKATENSTNYEKWDTLFVNKMHYHTQHDSNIASLFGQSLEKLDRGKMYVINNRDWLLQLLKDTTK